MVRQLLDSCGIIRVKNWDIDSPVPVPLVEGLGVTWPNNTGDVANGDAKVICIGPTDWLMFIFDPDLKPWLQRIAYILEGSTYRATDVSRTFARIRVDGSNARESLAKGCSLDFHPLQFPPGHSAGTRFAGMPVIVNCIGPAFELIVAQSYCEYLLDWLTDAALEFA